MRPVVLAVTFSLVAACQAGAGSSGVSVKEVPPAKSAPAAPSSAPSHAQSPAPPPGLSESEAEKICTLIRTAECERNERCNAKFLNGVYGDKATCIANEKANCKTVFMLPGTKITNDQAQACATRLSAAACDSTDEIPECLLPGVIADGGTCMSMNQCASANCEGGTFTRCGTCKPKPAKAAKGGPGAACKDDAACERWTRCDGGKCVVAGKAKGQKCNQGDSCSLMMNLGCRGDTCIEGGPAVEVGASCKYDEKTKMQPFCKAGGTCLDGKCVATHKEGESCANRHGCNKPLFCDSASKCVPPHFDTAACYK